MDLGDQIAERGAARRADEDLVADARVPKRQEHATPRVRVKIGIAAIARDRGPGQMEREVLGSPLDHDVALDVALRDRKVDRKARDLDAISRRDRTARRHRRRGRVRRRRARGRWGARIGDEGPWSLAGGEDDDTERDEHRADDRKGEAPHRSILGVQDGCRPNDRASAIVARARPRSCASMTLPHCC